jgi:hypothetical protein
MSFEFKLLAEFRKEMEHWGEEGYIEAVRRAGGPAGLSSYDPPPTPEEREKNRVSFLLKERGLM